MSESTRIPGDPPSSHWAIGNLIATYAELVDDGDFAGLGTLLADATFTGSGVSRSAASASISSATWAAICASQNRL
jgi:hypothetical protein